MHQVAMSATAGCHLRCTRMVPRQQGCHVAPQMILHAGMMCRTAQLSHVATALSSNGADDYTWPGHDAFDAEGDRQDKPPLPLPRLSTGKTITLVRHGQSQWNASGRIQGSCDLSLLTDKGRDQAEAARQQLEGQEFDAFFCSPLQRAAVTGRIIWAGRQGNAQVLPALREIDLYSFQGLFKAEGKQRFGEQYHKWKREPASLELDGHPPVRELWYRGSLALRSILTAEPGQDILVVAHNAMNQALICVALGLPPTAFRRLVQANAATTVLHFAPSAGQEAEDSGGMSAAESAQTQAVLRHMNQSPEVVSNLAAGDPPVSGARIILVACGSGSDGSSRDAVDAVVEAVSAFQVDVVLSDDSPAAQVYQEALMALRPDGAPRVQLWHPTRLPDERLEASAQERQSIGAALALAVAHSDHDSTGSGTDCTTGRDSAGDLDGASGGRTVVVVTSCERAAALLHDFCGLQQDAAVEVQPASISCIDALGDGNHASLADAATVHCVNSRAHVMGQATVSRTAVGAANASNS